MPEGDTLFRTAETLRKALLNKALTRFDSSVETVIEVAGRRGAAGRTVQAVEARGKHLLIVLRDAGCEPGQGIHTPIAVPAAIGLDLVQTDLVLRTHLRMTGSWHIYRPGEIWRKPANYSKVVLYTQDFVAPCFSAPVVDLMTARETSRHPDLLALGPDAMKPEFDAGEARARMRRHPDVAIGIVLLNQRAMAGVGNEFKSEIMFIRRISPFTPVAQLTDEDLDGLIAESHKLLRLNTNIGVRRTRFALNANERLWVYGRVGEPCRVCGTKIRFTRQGVDGRGTYYCPVCQAAKLAS
jgi:endonuclease-8